VHRTLALLGSLVAALCLASAALAADVHVRVEGQVVTIYGGTQPLLATGPTPLDALETASRVSEFYYHVAQSSFGPYVDQIGRIPASGSSGWVFKVNGAMPPAGADKVQLRSGDVVLWYWATFAAGGAGPPTLLLKHVKGPRNRSCYQTYAQDDQGRTTIASGALLRVNHGSVATSRGRACLPRNHGPVRATRVGSVRSNILL
jgi:hypothetical protein